MACDVMPSINLRSAPRPKSVRFYGVLRFHNCSFYGSVLCTELGRRSVHKFVETDGRNALGSFLNEKCIFNFALRVDTCLRKQKIQSLGIPDRTRIVSGKTVGHIFRPAQGRVILTGKNNTIVSLNQTAQGFCQLCIHRRAGQ